MHASDNDTRILWPANIKNLFSFLRYSHFKTPKGPNQISNTIQYISCWVFLAIHHMLYLCMCVFVSFCICIFVFAILTHGNTIFDILAHSSFHKYISCWVFLALSHMLYLCMCVFVSFCICIFVFAILTHGNTIFDILAHSSFHKYISCWVFLALSHMLYLCMCVFVSFCICVFVCVWDRVGIA